MAKRGVKASSPVMEAETSQEESLEDDAEEIFDGLESLKD